MHARGWTRRIGSALLAIGLVATMVATAAPVAAESRADTRTSLTASPSTSAAGQPVVLTATVSFNKNGTRTPTGLVYFGATNWHTSVYLGSAPVTGCSLVTRNCTATLVTTGLPSGRDVIGALYGGNSYFEWSAGFASATVSAAPPPGAPSLNSATAGNGFVALQWSAPTSGGPATSYNVYRSGTQGVQGSLLAPGVSGTTYTDTSVTNNSTYYYVVTAVGPGGQSPPSNQLYAHPPSSSSTATTSTATTTCSPGAACPSPTVTSSDGSTALQMTQDPSTTPSILTVQVGGFPAMQCSLPGSGAVVSEYHTTAADADKIAKYTVYGAAADFANAWYAAHTDMSGCYGSPDQFNGWSPAEGGTWAGGPWVYGPAPFNETDGLYEAFLGSCANHGIVTEGGIIEYRPCFVNINGGTYNTNEVHSPASANDPRTTR